MTNTLPVYKGYTVDYKLQEFRKMVYGTMPKTVPFNSLMGGLLLKLYEAQSKLHLCDSNHKDCEYCSMDGFCQEPLEPCDYHKEI